MNLFDKILDLIALPIRKLWRIAAHGTPHEQFRVLFTIAVLMVIVSYFNVSDRLFSIGDDEYTFLKAGDILFQGKIDAYRTPIYPLVCKICRTISLSNGFWLIALFQITIFFISTVFMHKASCLLAPKANLARFVAEACYSCNSAVCLYTYDIMSESLAISITVIFAYFLILLIKRQANFLQVILLSITYLVMLFLKPYFICLVPAFLIAIVLAWRKSCSAVKFTMFLGLAVNIGAYCTYCQLYKKQFGVFATTCIGTQNLVHQIRHWHKMALDRNPDPELKAPWLSTTTISQATEECTEIIRNNPKQFCIALLAELALCEQFCLPEHILYIGPTHNIAMYPSIPFCIWEWLILAFIMRHLWRWRKRKANVHIHAVFALCAISGIFTAVAGSSFILYSRLAMPVYPILCLMIAAPGNFREEE